MLIAVGTQRGLRIRAVWSRFILFTNIFYNIEALNSKRRSLFGSACVQLTFVVRLCGKAHVKPTISVAQRRRTVTAIEQIKACIFNTFTSTSFFLFVQVYDSHRCYSNNWTKQKTPSRNHNLTTGRNQEDFWGFYLIILPYFLYVFGQTGLNKQCRPRSNSAERGVWSGSTLFASHPAIVHTFTDSKIHLLESSIWKNVPNLSNLSKVSYENKILSQRVVGWGGGWGGGGGWGRSTEIWIWICPCRTYYYYY